MQGSGRTPGKTRMLGRGWPRADTADPVQRTPRRRAMAGGKEGGGAREALTTWQ